MTLREWREALLTGMAATSGDPDNVRHLFGEPYVLKNDLRGIHLEVIEGEPLVVGQLLEAGVLIFHWRGVSYGICVGDEEPFVMPPLRYFKGIRFSEVEPFKGKIDWEIEIPKLNLA